MGRILCLTSGLTGILYSSLELARRLSLAGHELIYAGPSEVRRAAEDQKLEFLPLARSRYEALLKADAEKSTWERLRTLRGRRQRAIEALAVGGLAESIRSVEPDLLLIDGEMHEHIIAAWAAGVPIVLLNTFPSIWKSPGLPPTHHFVRPGVGWKGSRIGMSLLWQNLRLKKLRKALSLKVRHVGCDRLSILRRLADDVGFDFPGQTDSGQWLIPFSYKELPVLSLHALEWEFPHQPAGQVHYVGPMVLQDRVDRGVTSQIRSELEALFKRRRESSGKVKLIYAGFGSSFTTERASVERLMEAAGERPDWIVLISLGDRLAPTDLGLLPANVRAFPWLPQTKVLKHADVAVSHGGINTIDESILCGVPLLIFCGLETDMAGNAARVVHHQIGIVGTRRDGPDAMGRHIDRLLAESRFQENVERLRSCYLAYAENRVAERVVDSLLQRSSREGSDPSV